MNQTGAKLSRLAAIGQWMQRHQATIRTIQWLVVLVYGFLIVVPVFLPLPEATAHLWSHFTLAAQFVFWGIWWPFVLLSMVLLGRVWCGVLCPEGTLAEVVSKFGRGKAIPRWMRWGGWPFVAFGITTIYGQMVSVYQYPRAVLLVLGGSTLAAMVIGLLYGREKRVWCKYLCPVNGVFALLARLAPFHYKVDEPAWRRAYQIYPTGGAARTTTVNCAPLVPLRSMKGAAACHMCGRCSGYRDAIALTRRTFSEEIVQFGHQSAQAWDTVLILYGLLGIAIGAFHWTASPWFIALKQSLAAWLIEHNMMWPLQTNAPWFLLTHYPAQNDVFSWLDGALVVAYIVVTGLAYGTTLLALLMCAVRALGGFDRLRLHHLAQGLIPIAGVGVFLGLSATTVSLLRAEHVWLGWVPDLRIAMLALANVWSAYLAWRIVCRYSISVFQRLGAMAGFIAALAWVDSAWWLMFWGFSRVA